jgi:hypothetical protein
MSDFHSSAEFLNADCDSVTSKPSIPNREMIVTWDIPRPCILQHDILCPL